ASEFIDQLMPRIPVSAQTAAGIERRGAQLREIALPLLQGRHGAALGFALTVAEALIESEKECLISADRAAKRGPKLILLQGFGFRGEEVRGIESVVAQKLPDSAVK